MGQPELTFNITSDKIDSALKVLRVSASSNYRAILLVVGKRVGVKMESMIPKYPQRVKKELVKRYTRVNADGESYQSAFKNQAQQNFVFWMLGQHKIPYKRTGLLGQSLNSKVTLSDDSLLISVGTNKEHAPFVIDEERQADIHKGTWWTLQETYRDGQGEIKEYAEQQFFFALGGNS